MKIILHLQQMIDIAVYISLAQINKTVGLKVSNVMAKIETNGVVGKTTTAIIDNEMTAVNVTMARSETMAVNVTMATSKTMAVYETMAVSN